MDVIKKINSAKSVWMILPELTENDLERAIAVAKDAYYNTGVSLISDEVYDVLVERLKILNPKSRIFGEVGSSVRGKKVELPYWMGSMDKIKSEDHLIRKWANTYKGPYVVSDKLDGISCLLILNHGKITLYTRGDGKYGQNISFLVDVVNLSADELKKESGNIAIRGELIMSKKKFGMYEKIFSNARNMVAGIVNTKAESLNREHAKDVDFVTYEVIEPLAKPSDQLRMLKKWGMIVVYYDIYDYIDLQILDNILEKRRKKSHYEIDGIVVTDDVKHVRNKAGNPPYSFAYKGLSSTANVKVLDVIWRPSKDGVIIPRIHFEKVRLSQADLEYTTGFNAKFIVDNKIGPGAIITVVRSGDVIPYILGVLKPAKKPALPDNLDYEWDASGVNIVLKNAEKNEDVVVRRLTKFVKNIGVDNLSEGIVVRLVRAGHDTIPKIMSLTIDDFRNLEGFGERLAKKLYNNLQKALNNLDILTLMVASNVFGRGFGEKKIRKILDAYPNIVKEYHPRRREEWENRLMSLDGFSSITVGAFLDPLPEFQKFYRKIEGIVDVQPYRKRVRKNGLFGGEVVVFTGFRNRDWEKFIEEEGGEIANNVTGHSTLLIYNDGEEGTAKYRKAKDLGIRVISKTEFAQKYNV
ncbi:MAG: BRCT domain-containing protein [Nitrososphaerota archaeon]